MEGTEYNHNIDNEIFNNYNILCDILNDYERKLNQYIFAMFYEGLDKFDYRKINEILIELKNIEESINNKVSNYKKLDLDNFYLKKVKRLQNDFYNIYKSIEKNVINKPLKSELIEVGSLLHLVFTNNEHKKIRLYSDASVMFSCQFHMEKTPSFGVTDSRGLCYCFGCGASKNIISYVRAYENLTSHEALQLLSRIYMINIENNTIDENHPKVIKYRNILLSNEFNELLTKLNDRVTKREENTGRTKATRMAKEKIKRNFETIERVRREEYNNNRNKQKRLILKMPNFD